MGAVALAHPHCGGTLARNSASTLEHEGKYAKGTDRGARPHTPSMATWWDADRERELIDTTTTTKWNGTGLSNQMSSGGCAAGTRIIPMGYADVLGDRREEAWWLCNNNTELRIYVSTALTTFRMCMFMQDPEYRTGVATMRSGYVQSPHRSWYEPGYGVTNKPA